MSSMRVALKGGTSQMKGADRFRQYVLSASQACLAMVSIDSGLTAGVGQGVGGRVGQGKEGRSSELLCSL